MRRKLKLWYMNMWLRWRHDWHLFLDKWSSKLHLWLLFRVAALHNWRIKHGYEGEPLLQSYDWRAPR